MVILTDLALDYERALIHIHMDRFAVLMDIPRAALSSNEHDYIERFNFLIQTASKRNAKSLEMEPIGGVLDDIVDDLKQYGYIIPEGSSPELTVVMRNKVSRRIQFYQDLLSVDGQFDDWQDLLRGKYQVKAGYTAAVDPLTEAERKILPLEEEALIKRQVPEEIIVKKPLTQDVYAVVYARRLIKDMVFN